MGYPKIHSNPHTYWAPTAPDDPTARSDGYTAAAACPPGAARKQALEAHTHEQSAEVLSVPALERKLAAASSKLEKTRARLKRAPWRRLASRAARFYGASGPCGALSRVGRALLRGRPAAPSRSWQAAGELKNSKPGSEASNEHRGWRPARVSSRTPFSRPLSACRVSECRCR